MMAPMKNIVRISVSELNEEQSEEYRVIYRSLIPLFQINPNSVIAINMSVITGIVWTSVSCVMASMIVVTIPTRPTVD